MTRGTKQMNEAAWLWVAKAAGAVAGSAISLAYILPAEKREAGIRFAIGLVCGLVFGGTAGLKIAVELGIENTLGPFELVLMGSAAASLCAWWALGMLMRAFTGKSVAKTDSDHKRSITDET
ncbi:DUF6107 family protein [Mesorhizobium sp. CAU 1732]|uniref:DUF6107 family protein n=1 Tax=Mesorhizobium sp. CAU 1732 TaxID=3140358 RepID=UPI003260D951